MQQHLNRSDPKRYPIAKIVGRHDKYPDARFEQNGLLFRADGTLCAGQEGAGPASSEPTLDTVSEVSEWVNEQKGPKGKKALVAYAEELEVEDPGRLGMKDLRNAIVEAFAEANG